VSAETASQKEYIADILDANQPLALFKLPHLSNLNESDLNFLKQSWGNSTEERRRQVVSQLVQLSQTNFRVNFSDIFFFFLHDKDARVRADAITGLADEEDYRHISPLVHMIKEDSSTEVKKTAVIALGKFAVLGEVGKLSATSIKEVCYALLAVLDDTSAGDEMHCLALEAVAPLNMPQVKERIEKAYRSSDVNMKTCAVRAMGRNCDEMWFATLLRALGSKNTAIRYESTVALGELGSEEALPYLIKLSEDEDTRIQEAAIKGIGEIGGEEARQALNNLSKSSEQRIRNAAKLALKQLHFYDDTLTEEPK
jgi:HEAT repeat protein